MPQMRADSPLKNKKSVDGLYSIRIALPLARELVAAARELGIPDYAPWHVRLSALVKVARAK